MRFDFWTVVVGGVSLIFLGYAVSYSIEGDWLTALSWLMLIPTFYVLWEYGLETVKQYRVITLVIPATILGGLQIYEGLAEFSDAVLKGHEVMQRELTVHYDRGYPQIGTGKNLAKLYLACHRETMDALHTIHVASQAMKLPPEVSPVFGELAKSDRTEAEYKCE